MLYAEFPRYGGWYVPENRVDYWELVVEGLECPPEPAVQWLFLQVAVAAEVAIHNAQL